MPRVKLAEKKYPPINWLAAAILERKKVMKLDWGQIAEIVGTSPAVMRKLASSKDPQDWPRYTLQKVCKTLGITYKAYVADSPEDPRNEIVRE